MTIILCIEFCEFDFSSLRSILLRFGVGEMTRYRFCDDGVSHTVALGPNDRCPDCKLETAERTMFVMNPMVSQHFCAFRLEIVHDDAVFD